MGINGRTFKQAAPDRRPGLGGSGGNRDRRGALHDDVSVWPNVVLRGDVNTIEIGARSNIQDGVVGHVTHDGPFTPGGIALVVGEDVTVGTPRCCMPARSAIAAWWEWVRWCSMAPSWNPT